MSEISDVKGIFSKRQQIITPTFKNQAYNLIKDAIIYQRFREDAIYSQEGICLELGISRTPVREALLELQKDGYISFCRGKGVKIVPIDESDVRDVLELRLYTEKICACLAAKRRTNDDLLNMENSLKEIKQKMNLKDGVLLYHLDHQFHRFLALASHNKRLYHLLEEILDNYLRFESKTVYNNFMDATKVFNEHYAILEAIKDGNADRAEQAVCKHLDNSFHRTLGKYWNT